VPLPGSADSGVVSNHATSVFLVDDSTPVRERLRELLSLESGIDVVGEADSPATAIEGIKCLRPAFVVLDFRLPDGTGLDVLRATGAADCHSTFIVLSNHASSQLRAACTAAGAQFFLDKSTEFDRLVFIIAEANAAAKGH